MNGRVGARPKTDVLELVVPLWAVALPAAVMPALWVWRRLNARSRRAAGLCPGCGYDLRATPGRCPECGTASAA